MENQHATLDLLVAALRNLTQYSDQHTAQLRSLLELTGNGQPETARQRTRRLELWRRMLQDIPLDERSFDDRFGLAARQATISVLVPWCRGYRAHSGQHPASLSALFGFVSLFLMTLLGLAESEAQRSLPQPSAAPGNGGRSLTHDCGDICGVLVSEDAVAEAIADVYSPQPRLGRRRAAAVVEPVEREWQAMERKLRFHRHGSTSMILRGATASAVHGARPDFALKLILYPFTRIRTLAQATREYAETYGTSSTSSRHLVRVWASFDSWILMDFIEGRTLAEAVSEEWERETASAGQPPSFRLDRLREKGLLLFEALEELQRIAQVDPDHGQFKGVHADLSPSNIIVSDADGAFKLIDLGRNYLYTHTITGTTGSESCYIAPEVRAGDSEIARADLYSLGQLLILFGSGRASTDGVVPDILYMRAALLARFFEDLIDADPARRLLIFSTGPEPVFSFARLKSSFLAELEMVQAAERGESDLRVETGWRALRELLRPLAGDPGREWRLWRMRRRQGAVPNVNRTLFTNWLLAWSLLSALVWAVTNSTVMTWFLRDLDLSWGNRLVELVQHISNNPTGLPLVDSWRHSDYRLPDWRHNLPARIVGLSFAIAAPKYYQMLFSGLTPLAIGWRAGAMSRLALATEAIMRTMAVAPCALVLLATLVEPRWWPINTAIGQCLTWLANTLTLAFIRAVTSRSREIGLSTVPGDDSKITGLSPFSQWAPTSLFYAAACLTIGTAIYLRLLHDIYVYALAVTSINLFLFYVIKCGVGGPAVRVAMVRTCLAAERVGRCQSSSALV
jgi:serine/threonine protein kinase